METQTVRSRFKNEQSAVKISDIVFKPGTKFGWRRKASFKKKIKSSVPYRTVSYRFPLQFLSRSQSLNVRRTVFSA
jgi:hypothetical protein